MSSVYPGGLDTFVNPTGTNTQDNPDHASQHANINDSMVQVQKTLGTTGGTAVLKSFSAGDFAAKTNGGTINGVTLGTPIIGTISIPGTTTALGFSAAIAPGVGTLTDAVGTLIVNAQLGNVFYCAMGTSAGNRTIGTPQNPTGYQQLTYAFKTSGSANGTIIWSSAFRGTPSALGTGTSWNYYAWRYNLIDSKWDPMGDKTQIQ